MRALNFYILPAAILLSLIPSAILKIDFYDFASEIFGVVSSNSSLVNFVISPFALHSALFLVFLGSKGRTKCELRHSLKLGRESKEELAKIFKKVITKKRHPRAPRLILANRLWLPSNVTIKDRCRKIIETHCQASIGQVDTGNVRGTVNEINNWVKKVTTKRINQIVTEADGKQFAQSMVNIVSSVYFSGEFDTPFQTKNSFRKKFRGEKKTVIIEFMRGNFNYKYGSLPDLDATVVEIPFRHSPDILLLLLPKTVNGLPDLTKKLKNYDLFEIRKHLEYTSLRIQLPKFHINTSISLQEPVQNCGIREVFSKSADLTGFCDRQTTNKFETFTKILDNHSVVKFTEMGVGVTGAEGVSAIDLPKRGNGKRKAAPRAARIRFEADHPFIFAIVNKQVVYFQGRIGNIDHQT